MIMWPIYFFVLYVIGLAGGWAEKRLFVECGPNEMIPHSWLGGAKDSIQGWRCVWLRLPSYEWGYLPGEDDCGWLQWTIIWSTQYGLELRKLGVK